MILKSKSDKRLIIEGLVNGKVADFLLDTGASVALINKDKIRDYGLKVGKKFNGTLVGIGGEMRNIKYCNTFVNIGGKDVSQFLIADISGVVESIKRETGIEILGIISLSQMKFFGINIDSNDNLIIIE